MKFPKFFPPDDILEQVEGVEKGLRQRQRLGTIGQLSFIIITALQLIAVPELCGESFQKCLPAAIQIGSTSADVGSADPSDNATVEDTEEAEANSKSGDISPWLFISILLLILSLFLWVWSRILLQESKGSFRYTYSIEPFSTAKDSENNPDVNTEPRLTWLQHDLLERLSIRVGRLSWLDSESLSKSQEQQKGESTTDEASATYKSHIQIGGYYLVRKELREDNLWLIEVTPWVRIGPQQNPKALSHPVKFRLRSKSDTRQLEGEKTPSDTPQPKGETKGEKPPELTREDYEKLLERVYSSVTTLVYDQIRQDVQTKIDLLPTNYYRALAYFYEAEDYANSNTLYAYQKASELYRASMNRYDAPQWEKTPKEEWHQALQTWRWRLTLKQWHSVIRQRGSRLWPRLGRYEVMTARAEIGYATVLIYQYSLAAVAGQRGKPSFAARAVVGIAIRRLENLSKDVAGRNISLFKAYITQALAWYYSTNTQKARNILAKAQSLLPADAQGDFQYLFAAGLITEGRRKHWARSLLRQSTALRPSFELSRLHLAYVYELLWRTRQTLEKEVAENVFEEYEKVLKLNPGNLSAWANRGYMRWLMDGKENIERAIEDFKAGREYKHIKQDSFVAELDYGLARIAAEQGNFQAAYDAYTESTSALLAQGYLYRSNVSNFLYHFDLIDEKIYQRFSDYRETVETTWQALESIDDSQNKLLQELDLITLKSVIDSSANNDNRNALREEAQELAKQIIACIESVPEKIFEPDSHSNYIDNLLQRISSHLKSLDYRPHEKRAIVIAAVEAWFSNSSSLSESLIVELERVIKKVSDKISSERIRSAVYAFVLNDYGDAAYAYYQRMGDRYAYEEAIAAYEKATQLHQDYVFAHYNLARWREGKIVETEKIETKKTSPLEEIRRIAPDWPYGKFARAEIFFNNLRKKEEKFQKTKREHRRKQQELEEEIKEIEVEIENWLKQNEVEAKGELHPSINGQENLTSFQTPNFNNEESHNQGRSQERDMVADKAVTALEEESVPRLLNIKTENSYKKEQLLSSKNEELANLKKTHAVIEKKIRRLLSKDREEAEAVERDLKSLIPSDLCEEAGLLEKPMDSGPGIFWQAPQDSEYSALQEEVDEIHIQALQHLGKIHYLRGDDEHLTEAQRNKNDKQAMALWNYIQAYYLPNNFALFSDIKQLAERYFKKNKGDEQYTSIFHRLFESQQGMAQFIREWMANDEENIGIASWIRYDGESYDDELFVFEKIERLEELYKLIRKRPLSKDCDYRDWLIGELRSASELEAINKLREITEIARKEDCIKILENLPGVELSIYKKLSSNIQQGKVKITNSELEAVLKSCRPFLDLNHIVRRWNLHKPESEADKQRLKQQDAPQKTANGKTAKLYFAHRTLELVLSESNFITIREWIKENLRRKLDKETLVYWKDRSSYLENILFVSIEKELSKPTPDADVIVQLFAELEQEAHLCSENADKESEDAANRILNQLIYLYDNDIHHDYIKEALTNRENGLFVGRVLKLKIAGCDRSIDQNLLMQLKTGFNSKQDYLEAKRLARVSDRNESLTHYALYEDTLKSTLADYPGFSMRHS